MTRHYQLWLGELRYYDTETKEIKYEKENKNKKEMGTGSIFLF